MAERIRVEVTADADDLRRALRQAGQDLGGFGRNTQKAARDVEDMSRRGRASLDTLTAKLKQLEKEKATAKVDVDIAKADAKIRLVKKEIRDLADEEARLDLTTQGVVHTTVRQAAANRESAASFRQLGGAIGQVNKQASFARNLIRLVKPAALLTGAGLAGQGLNAGVAGATGLVASLSELVGLAPAGVQALTALGQGGIVAKVALSGVGEALSGNEEALKKLSPQAREFVETLKAYKPIADGIRRSAQDGLFPGAEKGLAAAVKNADVVKKIVAETSEVLGRNAGRAGQLLGSKSVGKDLASLGDENAKVLDRGARAGLNFANAARHILVAAEPLTDWLSKGVLHFSQLVEQETAAARKSGELGDFFESTKDKAARLASIAESLAGGLWEVMKAAEPLGDDILESLDKTADHWEKWTQSVEGRNALRDYFRDAKPIIYEAAQLVDDLTTGILDMGSSPETAALIRQLRTELLPVLFDLVENTTAAFGPHLIDALVQVAKLFGDLAGHSGPLVAFVDTIGFGAEQLHELLQDFPELRYAVVTLAGGIGVYKALQIGAALTGVGKLITLLKRTKVESAAVGAVSGVQALTVGDPLGGGRSRGGRVARAVSKASNALPIVGAAVIGGIALTEAQKDKDAEKTAKKVATLRTELRKDMGDPKKFRALGDAIGFWERSMRKLGPEDTKRMAEAAKALGLSAEPAKRDLKAMREELERLTPKARAFQRLAREGMHMDLQPEITERGADAIATALNRMRTTAFKNLDDIKTHTRLNMRLIARFTVDGSAEAKEALATQFRNAADAVREQMKRSGKTTKEGLDLIESYMRRALRQYGITGQHATRYINKQDTLTGKTVGDGGFGGRGMAGGGMVRVPGAVGPDSVPMMLNGVPTIVAPGEDIAVVNRHQRPVIDAGLERVGVKGGLAGLFRKVTRPHHMAGGGIVGLGNELQREGYHVSENPAFGGVHPVHAPGSLHYRGQALDVNADDWPGGEKKALDSLAARLRAQHWHILWQVLGHFDHLHVDTLAGQGGGLSIPKLKRVLAQGLGDGALSGVVQGVLDNARSGAQGRLKDIVSSLGMEGAVGGGSSSAGGQFDRGDLQKLWMQAGGPADKARLMAAIALAESGGNPRAHNPSGASGLWQILGEPFPGDVYDPLTNARMAVAKYRSQGLGAWEAYTNGNYTQYLARGGLLGKFLHASGGAHIADAHGTTGDYHPKDSRKRSRKRRRPLSFGRGAASMLLAGFRASTKQLDKLEGPKGKLDLAELRANAVEEQPLKTVTVNGQEVEVRDEDAIATHLGELTGLIGIHDQIDTAKREQVKAARFAEGALEKTIREHQDEAKRLRAKVQANVERIKRLRGQVRDARHDLTTEAKKKGGGSRSRKASLRARIGTLTGEIDGLGRENIHLAGDPDRVGNAGQLATLRARIVDLRDPLPDVRQVVKDSVYDLESNRIDRGKLAAEYEEWASTKAPAADTSGPGAGSELWQQIAEDALRNLSLAKAQRPVFEDFRNLLGMRLVGSFAHGTDRVRESGLAIVHKDEQIISDPQGPYGSQLGRGPAGAPVINLYVEGDIGPLVKRMRVEIDGRAHRVVSQQNGRMARVIAAAPGGG